MSQRANWFSAITDFCPDVISIIGKDGELLFNSPAAQRIHGYTTEEMTGRNTLELIHPEDVAAVSGALHDLTLRPGGLASAQYRYLNKDGTYTWMEAVAYNQLDNPLIGGVVTISRDIRERKKTEEQLREALAMREEFISIASHELKTPLTVVRGQLDLLLRQLHTAELAPPPREHLIAGLESSSKQVDRLTELVKNLLDVTRIRAGKLLFDVAEFDLSAAVLESVGHFAGPLANADCALELSVESGIVGSWDRNRMEQVVENLLANAIKYAPGKPIAVALTLANGWVRLSVKDGGPGIDPGQHLKIFDRFERATPSRSISGLGLGLYISKQIVEAHGGRLNVESELGKGAMFCVELPVTALRA